MTVKFKYSKYLFKLHRRCLNLFCFCTPCIFQMVELDESTLIQLSLSSEVAQKIHHYLKQNLQASCLGDLLCSHTFIKHYLIRGGVGLEDEDMVMDSSLGGQGASSSSSLSSATTSSSSSASSCTMGSVSKKAKKETPADVAGCGSETESELPSEDDTKYPDDLEEKMKGKFFWFLSLNPPSHGDFGSAESVEQENFTSASCESSETASTFFRIQIFYILIFYNFIFSLLCGLFSLYVYYVVVLSYI